MSSLTEQQQSALARDRNISVTAGAGTGKTRLLVERYLEILINEAVDVKGILAITFTKKAAAEMKDRVVQGIDDKLHSELSGDKRKKLREIRDRMNSAAISTIHAFCARLLREYPVEAGLDPDFRQINDMQRQLLLDDVLEKEIESLDQDPAHWISLFRLFGKDTVKNMLQTALEHDYELISIVDTYEKQPVDEIYQTWLDSFLKFINDAIPPDRIANINLIVENILKVIPTDVRDDQKAINTLSQLNQYKQVVNDASPAFWQALFGLADYFTTGSNQAYARAGSFGSSKILGPEAGDLLIQLSNHLVPVIQKRLSVPSASDKEIIAQLKKFYQLYHRFSNRFSDRKTEFGFVDYNDLQLRALYLLQNNPEIKQKLASQYRFVMVDEFQDTNFMQWQLINLLGELDTNKFFIVGDPKQSIYGFRNADIRVFQQVKSDFIDSAASNPNKSDIVLGDSFRFAPGLGAFINKTFGHILRESDINPWEVGYDAMNSSRDDDEYSDINLAVLDDQDQAEYLARKAKDLSERYKFGQMAVLLRTRTHLSEIEEAFRRNGIPFRTIGGIGFYQRQEIFDIFYLIRFLLNPDDDNALIALLRSPFAGISDEGLFPLGISRDQYSYWQYLTDLTDRGQVPEEDYYKLLRFRNLAGQWLERREHISFHELLLSIFNESNYRAILNAQIQGERLTANLDKILQMAVEFESVGFLSLSDFAESLENLIYKQDKESEAQTDLDEENSIKIMTIHQAKGLEYEVVFTPYLDQELRNRSTNNCFFSELYGIASPFRKIFQSSQNDSYYLLDLLKKEQRAKDLAEMKRLFYVACTRARETLVLSMSVRNEKIAEETAASWLLNAHNLDFKNMQNGDSINQIHITKSFTQTDEPDMIKNMPVWENLAKISEMSKSVQYLNESGRILDSPRGEMFSATQIMKYDADPEEYKMRYHYGFFPDDYEVPAKFAGQGDRALLFGKAVHKYFEEYPDFRLDQICNDLEISDPSIRLQISDEILNLKTLVEKSDHLKAILGAEKYRNELTIIMKMGDDYLSGTIDRIFHNPQGLWEVIDYKTNRIDANELEETFSRYQIQIEVYALLLSHIYPQQLSFPISYYFTRLDKLKTLSFTHSELENIRHKLMSKISDMKKYEPYTVS